MAFHEFNLTSWVFLLLQKTNQAGRSTSFVNYNRKISQQAFGTKNYENDDENESDNGSTGINNHLLEVCKEK